MSSTSLAGKTILITGASKGIGKATALEFASLGAKVVINYSSDAAPAEDLVKRIGADKAIAIKANVGDIGEIERLVDETVKWGQGKIDVVIANAAIAPNKSLSETTEQDFEAVMNLNVKGPYFLAQKASPHMPPGSTLILLSTSLTNHTPITPNYLLYVTSKGAVEQMTRVLAKDLGRSGINVNAIAPGPTATELFFKGKSEELVKTIAGFNPHNRLGKPEEIARAMAWMVGGGGDWVNGQVLRVNGGMTV
ncbi:NAD(P)-binding protein [Massarina eburnea CBS 473.64]|uniref:NAD(P)-binding protein n=1 Tax=Massarina eburnea CBS 473.64 TaxID=1395130 RepID=A0A6A6SDM2_9PLEO|nr:NAD(P)-binding protein [Massarina eburnea CBS 473.64]